MSFLILMYIIICTKNYRQVILKLLHFPASVSAGEQNVRYVATRQLSGLKLIIEFFGPSDTIP